MDDATAPRCVLRAEGITKRYAGNVVLNEVSIQVRGGELLGLVGPNGSGKSTLLNVMSGVVAPEGGGMQVEGVTIRRLSADDARRRGIHRTFQGLRLVEDRTALENALSGLHLERRHFPWRPGHRTRRQRVARAMSALARAGVDDYANWSVRYLSHGSRRKVELARAVVAEPTLLLLDEPTSGVSTAHTERMAAVMRDEAARGCAVLLVEHNLRFVLDNCTRLVVLDAGRLIYEGTPHDALDDAQVREAYLGRGDSPRARSHG
jgi:ABC-type branched-subunit amino acid transport system ATPase component